VSDDVTHRPGTESDSAPAADPAAPTVPWPINLAPLLSMLRRDPTSFEFFQAVRILERLRPDRNEPGRFMDPSSEVVRFTVPASLGFPPSEIHALEVPDQEQATMSVNFMGLTGPLGVLPYEYTLLVADRERARDHGLSNFLDIFNHRLISLFYRAWKKNHVTVCYDDPDVDRLSEHLLDLSGQGVTAAHHGVTPLQRTLLFYVGLLAPQARGAVALERLLEDVFGVSVQVEQFIGAWYPLEPENQCPVGEEEEYSTQLGIGVVAGDEVWDQQSRVRIRLGPLSKDEYAEFLPTGSAHALLRWLVRYFSRDAFEFEVQLVLDRDAVRGLTLGAKDPAGQPLGWSTWIRTKPAFSRDPDETVFSL